MRFKFHCWLSFKLQAGLCPLIIRYTIVGDGLNNIVIFTDNGGYMDVILGIVTFVNTGINRV